MLKLFRYATPFVAIALLQAGLASISLAALSSVRAYVAGEGLWSKGQKDAIHFISRYAATGEERYYRKFQSAIAIPLADREARYAMEQTIPDLVAARAGLLAGGNYPDDIHGLIRLFLCCRDLSVMATAVREWRAVDPYLDQLENLGETIHGIMADGRDSPEAARAYLLQIEQLSQILSERADVFSASLGAASRQITLLLTAANILVAAGFIVLIVLHIGKAIRQRTAFENALRDEKEKAQVTLASISDAVIGTDIDGLVDYMNPEAERLLGMRAEAAKGVSLRSLFDVFDEATGKVDEVLFETLYVSPSRKQGQILIPHASWAVPVSIESAPLLSLGKTMGGVIVLHDRTSELELTDRLAWQASHDSLTELINRREFEARTQRIFDRNKPHDTHCMMMLDLDQFKVVNDTCGHAAGDELLRQTAKLLLEALGGRGTLARLGGDEFGVLVENCTSAVSERLAERLLRAVRDLRFHWNGRAFNISVSIGLAEVNVESSIKEAMSAADLACYMAKERGRDRIQVYHPGDEELTQRVGEMNWVQRIGTALEDRRFCFHAQEIRSLSPERTDVHVELLLRMRGEDGAMVPPGAFIPAAERFGLMPQIDRWVIRAAFALCSRNLRTVDGRLITSYAINLSGKSLGDDDFCSFVRQQLELHHVPPQKICFEITETSAIANLSGARQFIQSLRKLGCRFSLDDFGTGMSSVSYLRDLAVDYIKIDGCFVREILNSEVDRAMVEMITRLGKVLGKRVVAEFAETNEIVQVLRQIGVDYAQGYAIGKPVPLEEFGLNADETELDVA